MLRRRSSRRGRPDRVCLLNGEAPGAKAVPFYGCVAGRLCFHPARPHFPWKPSWLRVFVVRFLGCGCYKRAIQAATAAVFSSARHGIRSERPRAETTRLRSSSGRRRTDAAFEYASFSITAEHFSPYEHIASASVVRNRRPSTAWARV